MVRKSIQYLLAGTPFVGLEVFGFLDGYDDLAQLVVVMIEGVIKEDETTVFVELPTFSLTLTFSFPPLFGVVEHTLFLLLTQLDELDELLLAFELHLAFFGDLPLLFAEPLA